jgi:hypothetical protein
MRWISIVLLAAGCSFFANATAQQYPKPYVQSINDAEKEGITLRQLGDKYIDAVNVVDREKCVFKTSASADSLATAYYDFLERLSDYLYNHHFKWGQETRCWNRIFFHADGAVDYYLFDFKTPVSKEQSDKFSELFATYCTTHKLGMSADKGFAQCGKVITRINNEQKSTAGLFIKLSDPLGL